MMTWAGYKYCCLASGILLALAAGVSAASPGPINSVIVYNQPGRFAGWPANNGIWSWGDEIVVGFTLGYHRDKEGGHPIDRDRPQVPMLARSRDGGNTWHVELPSFLDAQRREKAPAACPGGIDFTAGEFALWVRMQGSNSGYSYFYCSNDRCHAWHGPYWLPNFGRKGIFGRTDYLIRGPHELTIFLTAAKEDGGEGWPLAAQTRDGGKSWQFQSWIGPQPGPGGYAIMPSTVRLSETQWLTYIRRRGVEAGVKRWWIEPYRSLDAGSTWAIEKDNAIDNAGNPAHLIKLRDGRLALSYGYRHPPYGVRARLSGDGGKTWTADIILRDDGAVWDLGYPRTVQRADGKLVTVYYFNDRRQKERYIAATVWDPK